MLARIAGGDAAAFEAVVKCQAERLRRIAARMLSDAGEAEEVAQETLLRLWRDAGTLDRRQVQVGAWCAQVTMNLCVDRLRRRRFMAAESAPERADPAPAADAGLDAAALSAFVAECLAALPERQRAAIILTYYEEYSNMDAANLLNLHVKAFESLLFRARRALGVMLGARRSALDAFLPEARADG